MQGHQAHPGAVQHEKHTIAAIREMRPGSFRHMIRQSLCASGAMRLRIQRQLPNGCLPAMQIMKYFDISKHTSRGLRLPQVYLKRCRVLRHHRFVAPEVAKRPILNSQLAQAPRLMVNVGSSSSSTVSSGKSRTRTHHNAPHHRSSPLITAFLNVLGLPPRTPCQRGLASTWAEGAGCTSMNDLQSRACASHHRNAERVHGRCSSPLG